MSVAGATRRLQTKPLVLAALAAIVVMGLGGLMTDIGPWSQNLRVPAWKPPDWMFGPIWTAIFGLWTLAAYLAWIRAPNENARLWASRLMLPYLAWGSVAAILTKEIAALNGPF